MLKRSLFCISLALMAASCATQVPVDVTHFTQSNAAIAGHSFTVYAEPTQSGSLEFQHYAGLVGGALQQHGLAAAPVNGVPDYVVQIRYASGGSHTEVYSDPLNTWGYYGRHGYGYGYGPGAGVTSTTLYPQTLEVDILDGAAWRAGRREMVFQGRAVGDSQVNDLNAAMPALVQALFTNFPGNSGATERVWVPLG